MKSSPIGVFDSGYGGLTVWKELIKALPQYDFIYLGDNARAPYGSRSLKTVYTYTLSCVKALFNQGCPLVIVACNTASAQALRVIQQNDLPVLAPQNRVLGVIRPTIEAIAEYTKTKVIGVLGTLGTVRSNAYVIEIAKLYPEIKVIQQACPMWAPLIEHNEVNSPGADYFIQRDIDALFAQNAAIDTIVLGCTHYPLLLHRIKQYVPPHIKVLAQGPIVAEKTVSYLNRHATLAARISQNGRRSYLTTDQPAHFDMHSSSFMGYPVQSMHLDVI